MNLKYIILKNFCLSEFSIHRLASLTKILILATLIWIIVFILPAKAVAQAGSSETDVILDYIVCPLIEFFFGQPEEFSKKIEYDTHSQSHGLPTKFELDANCSSRHAQDSKSPFYRKNRTRFGRVLFSNSVISSRFHDNHKAHDFENNRILYTHPSSEFKADLPRKRKLTCNAVCGKDDTASPTLDGESSHGVTKSNKIRTKFSIQNSKIENTSSSRHYLHTMSKYPYHDREEKKKIISENQELYSSNFDQKLSSAIPLRSDREIKLEKSYEYSSPFINDHYGFDTPIYSATTIYENMLDWSINNRYASLLPFFILHVRDGMFPDVKYSVPQDEILFKNSDPDLNGSFFDIDAQFLSGSQSSYDLQAIDHISSYLLDSGVANFDKFIITSDGRIFVSSGISDQFNQSGRDRNSGNSSAAVVNSWSVMPLLITENRGVKNHNNSGIHRTRSLQRYGYYANCTHTITDGFRTKQEVKNSEIIVGDAEICFDSSGKKARISYGYELWTPLSADNSKNCLSIDVDRKLCRERDSRAAPLISTWSLAE